MASRIGAQRESPRVVVVDRITISEQAAERVLKFAMLKSIALSVVVMVAFWTLLIAVTLDHAGDFFR
jgi:hypothetical protein